MKKVSKTKAELKKTVTYFDNNLQKAFGTSILENGTGKILLIVVLMVG